MAYDRPASDTGTVLAQNLKLTCPAALDGKVVQIREQILPVERVTVHLDAVSLAVASADDYGSVAFVNLPDRNILCLGCEADLSIVKGNVTNGMVAATDLDIAIGTAAASNSTLSSTMVNILPKQDVDTNAVTVTLRAHGLAATGVVTGIVDSPTSTLYINCAPGNITADDTLSITGNVTLYLVDLGNETS
jgi:hypothetical protein